MSHAIKCAILLEISSGATQRLPFSSESLKDDNIVAVMDELHEVIWLWMGRNTGLIMRRGSMRVARSLKAYGHEIGPSIVGRKLKDVVPVDGLKIETDSTEQTKFEKVISLFTREHTIKAEVLAEFQVIAEIEQPKYYGLSKSQRDDLVSAAIAAPSAGDDVRKIEEIVGQFRPIVPDKSSITTKASKSVPRSTPRSTSKSAPKPVSKPVPKIVPKPAEISPPPSKITTPPLKNSKGLQPASTIEIPESPRTMKDTELIGKIKAAILINSVLSEYTDIFVGVKTQDGRKVFSIECQDGVICKYSLDKSKIQFLPGSWDKISLDQKQKIQKIFIECVKTLLES
ncbi:MAG: hypothetical protein ACFFD2_11500 [Promethearchaeota archaeon]